MITRKTYFKLILSIVIVLSLCSLVAKANVANYRTETKPTVVGGIGTFILNLPYNLFFLLILITPLIKYTNYGKNIDKFPKHYISRFFLLWIIATVIGAIIDQFFVISPMYELGYAINYNQPFSNLMSNLTKLCIGLILIFLSFLLLNKLFLKMKWKYAVIIGMIMVFFNVIIWYVQILGYFAFTLLSFFFFIPGLIAVSIILLIWLNAILKKKKFPLPEMNPNF